MRQEEILQVAIHALECRQFVYMVVGSIASVAYSHPRFTADIDIVLDISPARVPQLLSGFPAEDGYNYYEPAIVQSVAARLPFNILHPASGHKLDFMPMRADEYGRTEMARRRRVWLTPTVEGFAASAEDVVLGKLWYYSIGESERHLDDIMKLWQSQPALDIAYIEKWLIPLDLVGAWDKLQEFIRKRRP
jgi:hypothetical protein